MARVIFTEDDTILAETLAPVIETPEIIDAYFAVKKSTESTATAAAETANITHTVKDKETLYSITVKHKVSLKTIKSLNEKKYPAIKENTIHRGDVLIIKNGSGSKSTAKKHTVAANETVYSISKKYSLKKGELAKLNNLKNNVISKGQKLKVSQGSVSTKIEFVKIEKATMGATVYVVVETRNLNKKYINLEIRQAGAKVVVDKDDALTVVNQKKAVTTMKADIGELATGKYSNNEDLKDLAVFKVRLDPDDEKKHKSWVDAINKVTNKKTKLYLHVDAHTPNDLKSTAIDYQGDSVGESKEKSAFVSASGKQFVLDIDFALHIYHTGEISRLNLRHLKKVKMIYHDSKDKKHELCECDVLQVDKRADGIQKKDETKKDPVTKKVTIVRVRNLELPTEKPEKTVPYSGTGIDAKKSYYYKNGDIFSEGKKYGKSNHRIQYKKAGGKVSILKMADPLNYSKDGVVAKYTWHQTKRRYCGPSEYAAFLGALVELGKPIKCGGSSYKDSTAFPSLKHCNGESIDTNYLSSKADQIKFINALHKFGFTHQVVSSSRKYTHTKSESKKATLHDGHMHSGVLKAKYKS